MPWMRHMRYVGRRTVSAQRRRHASVVQHFREHSGNRLAFAAFLIAAARRTSSALVAATPLGAFLQARNLRLRVSVALLGPRRLRLGRIERMRCIGLERGGVD